MKQSNKCYQCKGTNFFSFRELTHTDTGIDNIPHDMCHVENLCALADLLNEIRYEIQEPIYVNSAFRTPEVNSAVGGVPRSLHCQGRAADIRCKNLDKLKVVIDGIQDQLSEYIVYPTFIHIAL